MSAQIQVPKLNKVMFIDDDEYTLEHHKLLAKEFNLSKEILAYTNPGQALQYLSEIEDKYQFPDLILVDINMPEMDGHEFVEEISNMVGYNESRTIVAFLTSSTDMGNVVKADENMVEFYYWKPLTTDTLTRVLRDGFDIEIK